MSFHENVLMSVQLGRGVPKFATISGITVYVGDTYISLENVGELVLPPAFELVIRVEGDVVQLLSRKRTRRIWDMKTEAEEEDKPG